MNRTLCSLLPVVASIVLSVIFSLNSWSGSVISIEKNIYKGNESWNFVDQGGREVFLRGWNVSGSTKMVETGFKPFKNEADAERAFFLIKQSSGANIIRYLVSWEGVNPEAGVIDYNYLSEVVKQIKIAIKYKMYVLVDFHVDLFSRHLFKNSSKFTGNGAPYWVVPDYLYSNSRCFLCVHWAQNLISNKKVRLAYQNFWDNGEVETKNGIRYVQDEFLWQLGKFLDYLALSLTKEESEWIIGLDPFNEPADGGQERMGAANWERTHLWSFYKRVRAVMDNPMALWWKDRLLFSEPLMFWNSNTPFIPATGFDRTHVELDSNTNSTTNSKIEGRYVFNAHFYDAKRMGLGRLMREANSYTYLQSMEDIRSAAKRGRMPAFISEFGISLNQHSAESALWAQYRAQEVSPSMEIYSPPIASIQWHWDFYYDRHNEMMNGNPDRVISSYDAWNNENFSMVRDGGENYNVNKYIIERAYPRICDGHILSFYYHDLAFEEQDGMFNNIKFGEKDSYYFNERRFLFMIWKDKESSARSMSSVSSVSSEIYLPRHFTIKNLIVITDNEESKITLEQELEGGGYNLSLSKANNKDIECDLHFLLVADGKDMNGREDVKISEDDLKGIKKYLKDTICLKGENPISLSL
ncbi:MAG: cellulase family glycosylhydrolase [Oligoflexia bacterium]|nr:cellulase family glycosylhydrolase [Oligoflexia bacterium]